MKNIVTLDSRDYFCMRLFTVVLYIFYSQVAFPQKQNIWYFGEGIGLDFNVGNPVLLTDGKIFKNEIGDSESAATISDSKGQLLFYTDRVTVWNKEHKAMPSGTDLWGSGTTTQTIIVPKPGSANLYYIFTASPDGDDIYIPQEKKGFRYSLVDMSLENGHGDVIEKNILLIKSTTEKIAATLHANRRDVWVVMHEWKNNIFRSFLVTDRGISKKDIISSVGSIHQKVRDIGGINYAWDAIGQMKISPNGEKLALALYESHLLEIFDFDSQPE